MDIDFRQLDLQRYDDGETANGTWVDGCISGVIRKHHVYFHLHQCLCISQGSDHDSHNTHAAFGNGDRTSRVRSVYEDRAEPESRYGSQSVKSNGNPEHCSESN